MASGLNKSLQTDSPQRPHCPPPDQRRVGFCTRLLIFLASCVSCVFFTQALLFVYHYFTDENVANPTFERWEQPLACGLSAPLALFIF
ncbi:hypothetical protein CC79DRAFT_1330841 [Sarocladium strictum]